MADSIDYIWDKLLFATVPRNKTINLDLDHDVNGTPLVFIFGIPQDSRHATP